MVVADRHVVDVYNELGGRYVKAKSASSLGLLKSNCLDHLL